MKKNNLLRMDNVSIVVESLDDAISFFEEIGLSLEGRATIEGQWGRPRDGIGFSTRRDCDDGYPRWPRPD